MPKNYEVNHFQLEQQKFALKTFLEDEVPLSNLDVNLYRDEWLYGVVAEFRTHIWSHKLPSEHKTAETQLTIPTWNSAWQLWKANHAESKWFGWLRDAHGLCKLRPDQEGALPRVQLPGWTGNPVPPRGDHRTDMDLGQ
jgi:hypothetical protein